MIESRCGILCNKCEFYTTKACQGCLAITKPFWADIFWNTADSMPKCKELALENNPNSFGNCPVKACCENKKLEHCGLCQVFPCELATTMAYDPNQGDQGLRLKQCQAWSKV